MTTKVRKGGRPRMFLTPTTARTLHLPAEFWEILETGDLDGLSKGSALAKAIRDPALLEKLKSVTEAPAS